MGNKDKGNNKIGFLDILNNIAISLHLSDLPPYSRFNLLATIAIAGLIAILSIQPVLALVERILITIGNVIISIISKKNSYIESDNSDTLTLIICLAVILLEAIGCKIYCYFAQKINKTN